MICYPCTSYSFFVLFPLTIMTISDNKIKSNPHRYAKKAYFMKSYGGGTKNKSASPIFPISVYVVNLHTNHKNTKPTKTPNNTTKITHHTPKIQNRYLYRKPQEKSNKKHRHNIKKCDTKIPNLHFTTNSHTTKPNKIHKNHSSTLRY